MINRIGQPGARPQLDVFGQPYDPSAAHYRHIMDTLYVAVPSGATRESVERAIEDVRQWMIEQIMEEEPDAEPSIEGYGDEDDGI